jgi:hypothetical protein
MFQRMTVNLQMNYLSVKGKKRTKEKKRIPLKVCKSRRRAKNAVFKSKSTSR